MQHRLIFGITLLVLAADQASAYDLRQHQWQHRLLFLIAVEGDDPDLAAQRRDLDRRRDALLDRNIRVLQLFPEYGFIDGRALLPDSVRQLRRGLGVDATERSLILLGKDGGIKRRSDLNTELSDVFLQIDAMPMRRAEMREQDDAGIDVTSH